MPYMGNYTNHVTNGILLRADLHTLFDLGLIRIHPETKQVFLSSKLMDTAYGFLDGTSLTLPRHKAFHPSEKALAERKKIFD